MSASGAEKRQSGDWLETRPDASFEEILDSPGLGPAELPKILARKDLSRSAVLRIARNKVWIGEYPVKLALLKHPNVARESALPLLKYIHLFDLVDIAKTPGALPEIKRLAEEAVLARMEGIALGQKITLARTGTTRLAAALLKDSDRKVVAAAMSNPGIRERDVAAAASSENLPAEFAEMVSTHDRWRLSRAIRQALILNPNTPLELATGLLRSLDATEAAEMLVNGRLPDPVRAALEAFAESGSKATKRDDCES